MKIINDKKNGFISKTPILILDKKKQWFYQYPDTGKKIIFNLPKGIYYTKNKIKKIKNPVMFESPKLPHREKDRPLPKKIKFRYEFNPNKGTIVLTKDTYYISIDKKFKSMPRPFKRFVKYHELGHHLYKTEKFADEFAYRCMLNDGFNPTQIYLAAKYTLDNDTSIDRISRIFLLTKKHS